MLRTYKTLLFGLLISISAIAQNTYSVSEVMNPYLSGRECYETGQYAAAIRHFSLYIDQASEHDNERFIEAQYYVIMSSSFLQNKGIESSMVKFMEENEGSILANNVGLELCRIYFLDENYKKVIKTAQNCDEKKLPKAKLPTFLYQKAYSFLQMDKASQAKPLFKSVVGFNSDFYNEALYYYSYLQYKDENYNVALSGFETLQSKGEYSNSVPYYLAQIYFIKEEFSKLTTLAPSLLQDGQTEDGGEELSQDETAKNSLELNRITGDAYYYTGDYANAIKYLEAYQASTSKISRQDLYHLGMAYYQLKNYDLAAQNLAQISAKNDALSQSAYTFLGECFVRTDEKDRACLAFGTASKYNFDPVLREDAYYNYVKLSYETAVSPFNGTIGLLEEFINEFPDTEYKTEIYTLMYNSYMTTTSYKDACVSVAKIKDKDARLEMASQRVHYYRAVEFYNQGKYTNAIAYFKTALEGKTLEKQIKALTLYWLGDSYFQIKQYDKAMVEFNNFITTSGSYSLDEFELAHYNIGYCYFKTHSYSSSIKWFRKFTQLEKTKDPDLTTDANNRVGDCFYLQRNYYGAIKYYGEAIASNGKAVDYAYFQKGFCQGLSNYYDPKIVTLKKLISTYPNSAYADDALYEIAKTWVTLKRYDEAIVAYKKLPVQYPNSKYAAKSLLNAGLTYYNNSELVEASQTYKQVVIDYKGTEEARAALAALKNISIDQNSVDEYIAYTKEVGTGEMHGSEEDSLTFLAAEKMYMAQNFTGAINAFESYTSSYSNGQYVLLSYFYMADSYMQLSNNDEAMKCLEYITSQPRSMYTEQSLSVLSATYFNDRQYDKALETYKKLLDNAEQKENVMAAKVGIMECNYALDEAGATILAVENLLKETTLSTAQRNQALYYKAQSYLKLRNTQAAKESFDILAQDVSNAYGAEAKYRISKMYYDASQLAASKKEILDFINKGTPEQYWLAKGFILLSDIYVQEADLFQAKQYLLSIKDNYQNDDDILDIVEGKLASVIELEEAQNQKGRDSLNAVFKAEEAGNNL